MNNQLRTKIFKNAMLTAQTRGWDPDWGESDLWETIKGTFSIPDIIFDHDFAIAIWGPEDKWQTTDCTCGGVDFHIGGFDAHNNNCARVKAPRGYKHHLAKMVVEEEPLEYLRKFI